MRLYFKGLLPLIDIFDTGFAPQCKSCSTKPFNGANHVLNDDVKYQASVIYWKCDSCNRQNRYRLTNDGIRTIGKGQRGDSDYTQCAVIAKVDSTDDCPYINYHAWIVKMHNPKAEGDKKRGYSALSCKYMGYVHDSPDNDGQFDIMDGHSKRSTPDLKKSLSTLLNSNIGYYEEYCEGCNSVVEVSPSWKQTNNLESEPVYCIPCYTRMME